MLELSIFGSLMLLLLGLIVNYGLQADYNQAAGMRALRGAAAITRLLDTDGNPIGRGTFVTLADRQIPDPLHPLAVGGPVTVTDSASILGDHLLDTSVSNRTELPRLFLTVQGQRVNCQHDANRYGPGCLISGLRVERNVLRQKDDPMDDEDEGVVAKYREIYGGPSVLDCYDPRDPDEDGITVGEEIRADWPDLCFPAPADTTVETHIIVIDQCEGEIMDFIPCVAQSRQLVDEEVCGISCRRGQPAESDVDCTALCQKLMNPPNQTDPVYDPDRGGPWYAANYTETDSSNNTYDFPALTVLFTGTRGYGLQPSAVEVSEQDLSLDTATRPNPGGQIQNRREIGLWHDTVTRNMQHRRFVEGANSLVEHTNRLEFPVVRYPRCANSAIDCGGEFSNTVFWTTPSD